MPIKYHQAVQTEIKRMIVYGIVERTQSPYINHLVNVIKRDGRIRLHLDAVSYTHLDVYKRQVMGLSD